MSECPRGKVQHRTAAAALAFHDRRYPGTYRRAYRCWDCGKWHLSTTALKDMPILGKRIR